MSISGSGFTGLSLLLGLASLSAQPPETVLKAEISTYDYSSISDEMAARANDLEISALTTGSNLAAHSPNPWQRDPETPSVTVRAYSLANAPTEDPVQAHHATGRIFKQAGIEIRWLSCALSLQESMGIMQSTGQAEAMRMVGLGVQSDQNGMKIEIHVYNYSAVSTEILARAERESAHIFEKIGIATAWLVCPRTSENAVWNRACELRGAPTHLTLRLLSNSMAERQGAGADIFGAALQPANSGFGVVADVYADRTRELAAGHEFEVVLGRVIAHELGHLLIGKNSHSAAGIMHTPWRARDLEPTREAAMSFLPGEARRIREQVLARMSSDGTP